MPVTGSERIGWSSGPAYAERIPTYVWAFRSRAAMVVAIVVLVMASAIGFSLNSTKRYDATAKVLVNQDDVVSGVLGISSGSIEASQRELQTHVELVKSPAIADAVRRRLGLTGESSADLLARIQDSIGQSNVLTITASDTD